MKATAILTATLGLALGSLHAQTVPPFINYQGKVTDNLGVGLGDTAPVNRKVIFRIFDAASAGTRLWSEQHTVTISKGEFSVLLGNGINANYAGVDEVPLKTATPLDTVFTSAGILRYVEILVDNGDNTLNASDAAIAPRQQITSTAYSFRARSADTIASGTDLQLNGSADYGLGWYGATRLFNGATVNGPVLFGQAGGALGSVNGATKNIALRWNAAGAVGIGSADLSGAAATTKLVLQGDDANTVPLQLNIRGNTDTNKRLLMGYNTTGNYASLQSYSGASTASNLLLNPGGGNVGIGTSAAPTQALDVTGNGRFTGTLTATGSVTGGSLSTAGTVTGGAASFTGAVTGSSLSTAGTVTGGAASFTGAVTAGSFTGASFTGNVGIGTAASVAVLQLSNATQFGERLRFSGQEWTSPGNTSADGPTFLLGANRSAEFRQLWLADSASLARNTANTVLRFNVSGTTTPWIDAVSTDGTTVKNLALMPNGGNLGIGTTTPTQAKLVVIGSVTQFLRGDEAGIGTSPNVEGNADAYTSNGVISLGAGFNIPISIWASNSIIGTTFIARSDKRIKDVIGHSDPRADLELINRLRVTDYRMKDRLTDGSTIQKGLIAQEVEAIIPEAVTRTADFIPDVYAPAVKTTFESEKKVLSLELAKPHLLAVGEKVRVHAGKETIESEIMAVPTPTTFSVKASSPADRAFVYGRQVNDLRAVNYDRIFITAVGAVQELARKVDDKDAQIVALQERLATLEAKDKARDAKMASIEKLLTSPDQPATRTISLKQGE